MHRNQEEQFLRDEAKGIDVVEEGIPGAPNEWVPPRPPDTWGGYAPKHNASLFFWTSIIPQGGVITSSSQNTKAESTLGISLRPEQGGSRE